MMLTLYAHPLSSYCWKALIALYENDTPFNLHMLDSADSWAAYRRLWPIRKMPLLRDDDRGADVPEASIIIEYLDQHYPGRTRFVPDDAETARDARLWDRIFDNYVHNQMGNLVADRLRPADKRDPTGVAQAQSMLRTAYDVLEAHMAERQFAAGDSFTLADCAAAPALFYGDKNISLQAHPRLGAYLDRLRARPSFARVLKEAEPYFQHYPADYS